MNQDSESHASAHSANPDVSLSAGAERHATLPRREVLACRIRHRIVEIAEASAALLALTRGSEALGLDACGGLLAVLYILARCTMWRFEDRKIGTYECASKIGHVKAIAVRGAYITERIAFRKTDPERFCRPYAHASIVAHGSVEAPPAQWCADRIGARDGVGAIDTNFAVVRA
jgi:hypothetical protein